MRALGGLVDSRNGGQVLPLAGRPVRSLDEFHAGAGRACHRDAPAAAARDSGVTEPGWRMTA